MRRSALSALCCLLAIAAQASHAQAPAFPSKPVRIIVPFPPGGGLDIVARVMAPKLSESWGQQAIVENRAGASGTIGTEIAARAAPEGYTWFFGTMGNLVVSPLLPQTPTISESGVPGYELTNWFGLAVPVATPRELVTRLYGDVSKVLAQPDVRDRIQGMGADVIGSAPEQFAAFMRAETAKWAKVVKEANIRAE